MSKPTTYWCVFNDNGRPLVDTLRWTKRESEAALWEIFGIDRDYTQWGYTIRRVNIVVEGKPND